MMIEQKYKVGDWVLIDRRDRFGSDYVVWGEVAEYDPECGTYFLTLDDGEECDATEDALTLDSIQR